MHVNYAHKRDYEMPSLTIIYTKYLVSIGESGSQFFPLCRSEIINTGKRPRLSQFVLKIPRQMFRNVDKSAHHNMALSPKNTSMNITMVVLILQKQIQWRCTWAIWTIRLFWIYKFCTYLLILIRINFGWLIAGWKFALHWIISPCRSHWMEEERIEMLCVSRWRILLSGRPALKKETFYAPLHATVSNTDNLKSVERINQTQLFQLFAWHDRTVLN
jgi:hypothetical protein